MTFLRHLVAFALLAGCAGASFGAQPVSAHYSFMDIYRFATAEQSAGLQLSSVQPFAPAPAPFGAQPPAQLAAQAPAQFPEYQLRVASTGAQPAMPVFSVAVPGFVPSGFAFSSAAVPAPSRWLLILSGLALAAWVARRRLGYSL